MVDSYGTVQPMALNVDWSLAQAMFQEGVGLKQISARTGIPYAGLAKRSKRYNWRPLILAPSNKPADWKAPRSIVKPESRAAQWQAKVLDIVDTHLSTVIDRSTPDVSLDELEQLVRITDTVDKTARRTFGLDNERHDTLSIHVQSELAPAQPRQLPAQTDEIVDVETVPTVTGQDTSQPGPAKSE